MNACPSHAHLPGPRNASKRSTTSSVFANLDGWVDIASQRETFATGILAKMAESVSAQKMLTTAFAQLDSVDPCANSKVEDATRTRVSMVEPARMSPLDLFACVQQGQQVEPAIRTQEMSAPTTLVFMDPALTKLGVIPAIVKKASGARIVT